MITTPCRYIATPLSLPLTIALTLGLCINERTLRADDSSNLAATDDTTTYHSNIRRVLTESELHKRDFSFTLGTAFTSRIDRQTQSVASIFSTTRKSQTGASVLFSNGIGEIPYLLADNVFIEFEENTTNKATADFEYKITNGTITTNITAESSEKFIGSVNPSLPISKAILTSPPETIELQNHALRITSAKGTRIIKLRSPISQLYFGHPLLNYSLSTPEGFTQTVGCFVTSSGTGWANTASEAEALLRSIVNELDDGHNQKDEAQIDKISWSAELISNSPLADRQIPEALYTQMASAAFDLRNDPKSKSKRKQFYDRLMAITYATDDHFREQDAIIFDAYARGKHAEHTIRLIGKDESSTLPAIRSAFESLPPGKPFAIAFALASIGCLPTGSEIDTLRSCILRHGDDALRAAYSAHWEIPVGEQEIDAILKTLHEATDIETESAAVETLILLDHVASIPKAALRSWVHISLNSSDIRKQRRSIAYLMNTRSGRQHLRALLAEHALSAEAKQIAKSIVTTHTEATKTLQRYDFMDEAEFSLMEKAF